MLTFFSTHKKNIFLYSAALFVILFFVIITPRFRTVPEVPQLLFDGEEQVSVSSPIRFAFPYPGAHADDIPRYVSSDPEFPGVVSFHGNILTIDHGKNLRYDTTYVVRIQKGLPVGQEQVLPEDFTFSFRTRPRHEERHLRLTSYSNFQYASLNFYEDPVAVGLSADYPGKYRVTVYKSSPERLLQAAFYSPEFDRSYRIKKESFADGTPLATVDMALTSNVAKDFHLPVDKIGTYYVEADLIGAVYNPRTYQFFITVTKQATRVERLGTVMRIWVVDQKSGVGVPDIAIEARGLEEKAVLFRGITGGDGIYEAEVAQGEHAEKPRIVQVGSQDDAALVFLDPHGYGDYGSIYAQDSENQIRPFAAYVYTDRPVYRPGDRVNFKSIIRGKESGRYLPVQKEMTVVAQEVTYGENGATIFQKRIASGSEGSFADFFELSREIKSGEYELLVKDGDHRLSSAKFNVEFYQKPEFEIMITSNQEALVKGSPLLVNVSARYFFGGVLANENVALRVYTDEGEIVAEQSGTLDEKGVLRMSIPTEEIDVPQWYGYHSKGSGVPVTIEARVVDRAGNLSVGTKTVTVFRSAYTLSVLEPENIWNLQRGIPYRFRVALDGNLSRVPETGHPIAMKLEKKARRLRGSQEQDRTAVHRSTVLVDAAKQAVFEITFPDPGSYFLAFSTDDATGNRTAAEMDIWISADSRVHAGENRRDFGDEIVIVQDKSVYELGDRAQISFQLPRSQGQLLWSTGKDSFYHHATVPISSSRVSLEIPITEELVPGFYLHAALFYDDAFLAESRFIAAEGKRLRVDVKPSSPRTKPGEEVELALSLRDEKNQPVSGEASLGVVDKGIFALQSDATQDIYDAFYPKVEDYLEVMSSLETVSTTFAERGGCFLAGTAIFMWDGTEKNIESVKTGDMVLTRESPFSGKLVPARVSKTLSHIVAEYLVINGMLRVTPVHRVFVSGKWQEIGKAKIGDWLMGKNGVPVKILSIEKIQRPVKVYNLETGRYHTFFSDGIYVHNEKGEVMVSRSNFVDTAYWNARIATDRNGEARVRFRLPDNVTTWVALSKAVTRDTKVGQGSSEFMTTKELLIIPALPQFFRSGDTIFVSAAVHNNLPRRANLRALLRVEGASILDDSIKRLELLSGEQEQLSWQIAIRNAPGVKLTFQVEEQTGERDAVERRVSVYPSLNVAKRVFSGSGPAKFDFPLEQSPSPEFDKAVLTISSSVLSTLPGILEKLTGYPYGCVEQTMSKHLPNLVVFKNKNTLGLDPKEDVAKGLQEGFDRLNKFQHRSGGFGWWEGDEDDLWMSGYVLEGLIEARDAGLLSGREEMYQRLRSYLHKNFSSLSREEKAYAGYALSRAEPEKEIKTTMELLADSILAGETMGHPGKGYVALALAHNGSKDKARRILDLIMQEIREDHWEVPELGHYDEAIQDEFVATGVNFLAMVEIDFRADTAQKIIRWLMENRNGYEGLWGSTRQSTQILIALVKYLSKTGELHPDFSYRSLLNQTAVKSDRMSHTKDTHSIVIPYRNFVPGKNSFEIQQSGTGSLFWSMVLYNYIPAEGISGMSPDVSITRSYFDERGIPIAGVSNLKVGDIVKVRLDVTARKRLSHVLLEDFLPASLVPQNPRLLNAIRERRNDDYFYAGDEFEDLPFGMSFDSYPVLDIRDEKVGLLLSELNPGGKRIEYLARVGYAGSFASPAPRIELMYAPDKFSVGKETIVKSSY